MVKEYVCTNCGKIFSQKGHFTNHMKKNDLVSPLKMR